MFRSIGVVRSVVFGLLLVGSVTGAAVAQSSRGELAGSVTDTTGAAIPGATVDATNQATGGKNEAKSSSAGSYRFSDIPLGVYTVTVTAPGFATTTNTGVQIQINSTTALNIILKAGAISEVVNVDASGLRLETESSDISGTISNKQIEDLPLSLLSGVGGMRSPETFVFLLPGTTGPGSGTSGNTGNGVFFSRLSGGQAYGAGKSFLMAPASSAVKTALLSTRPLRPSKPSRSSRSPPPPRRRSSAARPPVLKASLPKAAPMRFTAMGTSSSRTEFSTRTAGSITRIRNSIASVSLKLTARTRRVKTVSTITAGCLTGRCGFRRYTTGKTAPSSYSPGKISNIIKAFQSNRLSQQQPNGRATSGTFWVAPFQRALRHTTRIRAQDSRSSTTKSLIRVRIARDPLPVSIAGLLSRRLTSFRQVS